MCKYQTNYIVKRKITSNVRLKGKTIVNTQFAFHLNIYSELKVYTLFLERNS